MSFTAIQVFVIFHLHYHGVYIFCRLPIEQFLKAFHSFYNMYAKNEVDSSSRGQRLKITFSTAFIVRYVAINMFLLISDGNSRHAISAEFLASSLSNLDIRFVGNFLSSWFRQTRDMYKIIYLPELSILKMTAKQNLANCFLIVFHALKYFLRAEAKVDQHTSSWRQFYKKCSIMRQKYARFYFGALFFFTKTKLALYERAKKL